MFLFKLDKICNRQKSQYTSVQQVSKTILIPGVLISSLVYRRFYL